MTSTADIAGTTGELINRFQYADTNRKQYEERALRWYKLYVGWRKELTGNLKNRSNLHIPRTYEEVDTLRSRFMKAMFASRPYIDFMPRPRDANPELLQMLEDKAKLAGSLVDDQLNNLIPEFYDFITCFLIYPVATAAVGWRYEKRKVKMRKPRQTTLFERLTGIITGKQVSDMTIEEAEEELVEYDDNDFTAIDFFDFWWDPRGRNLDNSRFCFHREWLTVEELKGKLELLRKAGGGTIYEPDSWDSLAGAAGNLQEGREDRLAQIGLGTDGSQGYWKDTKKGYLNEVLNYWEDGRYALLINRSHTVYDGQSPYSRHGKKPFISCSFEPLPGEFAGMSAVQIIEHLQAELNTSRNQRIDNVSMVLNRMWKARKGADIDENELVSRPHGVIWLDSMEDVQELAFSDVVSSAFKDEDILKSDMENALGVPAVVRGADPMSKQTATEVVTKNTSAGFRFDVKVMLYEALDLKRMAYLMDCNNQQFISDARVVRIYGPLGMEWKRVDPMEILGEHDYSPAGSSVDPMANKEIRREQLNSVMEIAMRLNNPYINLQELTKLWLQSYDIRSVDKLLLSPEEMIPPGGQVPGEPTAVPGAGSQMGPEQIALVQQALGGGIRGPG